MPNTYSVTLICKYVFIAPFARYLYNVWKYFAYEKGYFLIYII